MLQQVMLMTEEACFFGDYKTQKTRLCLDWAKGQKKKKKKRAKGKPECREEHQAPAA